MMPESTLHAHLVAALRAIGWCVAEHFLEPAKVALLAQECRELAGRGGLRPASVGRTALRKIDTKLRGDSTCWFDPHALSPAQKDYRTRIDALRIVFNRELLLGLESIEAHHAVYPIGAGYARHRDRFRDDDTRVLSSVLYLNPDWDDADGGALRIYLDAASAQPYVDVFPRAGTLVLFLSADFEHEVLPARRERLSIAGWLRRTATPL